MIQMEHLPPLNDSKPSIHKIQERGNLTSDIDPCTVLPRNSATLNKVTHALVLPFWSWHLFLEHGLYY